VPFKSIRQIRGDRIVNVASPFSLADRRAKLDLRDCEHGEPMIGPPAHQTKQLFGTGFVNV
jgi:hypothetical protein